jgi:nitroreductase
VWLKSLFRQAIMDFFEVVKTRQSIRAYQDQPIDPATIQQILDVINRAPSAGNLQGYEVYLVTKRDVIQALAHSTSGQNFITQAALVLVFCAHPERSAQRYNERGRSLYCIQDATIACAYAQLAVTALGLASVWVGAFNEDAVRTAIGVGSDLRPVAFLPIGYAAETPEHRSRRALAELVHRIE